MKAKNKSDLIKAQEIVTSSGNTFQYEVINFLRKAEWDVIVSPFYVDNISGKPREVDIIAQKKYFFGSWANDPDGIVVVRLIIECKYLNNAVVFWFDKKNIEKAVERLITDTPLKHPLQNMHINDHHYYSVKTVAKLFASSPAKDSENDLIYKALNQCLSAYILYRKGNLFDEANYNRPNLKTYNVSYPVIVLNNFEKAYYVKNEANEVAAVSGNSPFDKSFQLEVDYAYQEMDPTSRIKEYFLVDIVNFQEMSGFLGMLEKLDIGTLQSYLPYLK